MSLCYETLSAHSNLNLPGIKFPFLVRYWVCRGELDRRGYSAVGFCSGVSVQVERHG